MSDANDDRPAAEPSGPSASEQAKQHAERAREYVMRFEMPQRLLLLGSGAALLFGFFPWWAVKGPLGGASINGFQGWGWLYFVAAAGTILLLTVEAVRQPLIGSLAPEVQRVIFFGLSCATLLFGPLMFLFNAPGGSYVTAGSEGAAFGMSVGKTIWLWFALIAAGVAVAGGAKLLTANSRSTPE